MARKKRVLSPAELRREKVKKEMTKEVKEYPDIVDDAIKMDEKMNNYKKDKVLDVVDLGAKYGIVLRVKKKINSREYYFQDKFYVEK